jgi:hypothetical protein
MECKIVCVLKLTWVLFVVIIIVLCVVCPVCVLRVYCVCIVCVLCVMCVLCVVPQGAWGNEMGDMPQTSSRPTTTAF